MSQSLIGSADFTKFPRSGALGALAAVRLEMCVRNLVPVSGTDQYLFTLSPCGAVFIAGTNDAHFFIADYVDSIFDGVEWHVPGYTAGPRHSTDFLLRFQFDPSVPRVSLEVWDIDGNGRVERVITGVSAAAWNVSDYLQLMHSGQVGEVDFCRLYTTNVALGAAAPTRVLSGAPVHAWELEGTLTDTGSGTPSAMVMQGGGVAAYGIEPFAPTAPVVLDSLGYFTGPPHYIEVNYTDPNTGSFAPTHYDVERRTSPSGDWRAIGWAVAGAATYTDKIILHAEAYDYRVRARNRFGVASYSNILSVTTFAGADTNPTVTENAKAGTAAWNLTNPATAREIEGYCDATSYNRGATVNLKVNSLAGENFNVEIFRLGWYGGLGARRVRNVLGVAGTAQTIAAETGVFPNQLRAMAWTTSYALALTDADPTEWPSGIYLARLTQVTAGKQAYMIFCVRDDARQSKYLYNQPVNTYQAYNAWPMTAGVYAGRGLYGFNGQGGFSTTQVNFDRPYSIPDRADGAYGIGAGEMLALLSIPNTLVGLGASRRTASSELNMLRWLEKEGYDVQYCTDVDLHASGDSLWRRCYTILFPGHQEYWTRAMRDTVVAARDYGRHLDFFGANAAYWQVRYVLSNRGVYCAKLLASDPVGDAPTQTKTWRDLQGVNSSIEGEWKFVGVQYQGDPVLEGPMTIALVGTDPLMAGTGLTTGDVVPGAIGYEWDREDDAGESHSGIKPGRKLIANSVVTTGGHPDPRSHMVLYENTATAGPAVHNGAVVCGTGTLGYAWTLDDYGVGLGRPTSFLHTGMQQLTRNILAEQSEAVIVSAGTGGGAGVATHLAVIQQPGGFAFGSSCTTPAIIAVVDDDENEVTDYDGFITVVGLASVLSGPTRLRVYNGRVTFRRLAGRTLGNLSLSFSSPGLAGVTATTVTVTAQTGAFRGVCELPRVVPVRRDPVAPIVQVVSGAALQAALNGAAALTASSGGLLDRTFIVNDGTAPAVILPNRPADATGLISVEGSSAPCPVGTRAIASMMGARARFESADGTVAAIATAISDGSTVAHHYRLAFIGAKMTDVAGSFWCVAFGTAGPDQETHAQEPHHLYVDRCVFDGGDYDMRHTLAPNCRYLCCTDSSLLNGHHTSADGNALCCWNGSGEHFFGNTDIQGSGECVIYGGSDPDIPELIPSDVTLAACQQSRPLAWRTPNPGVSYPPGTWEVKNNTDLKNVQRYHEYGNIVENSWSDAQNGSLYNIKSVNQDGGAPWSGSSDLIFELGVRRNAEHCFALAGTPEESKESSPLCRVLIENNVAWNIGQHVTQGGGSHYDVSIIHNTYNGGASGYAAHLGEDGDFHTRFVYRDNIATSDADMISVTAQGQILPDALEKIPGGILTPNVWGNTNPVYGNDATFPAGNHLDGVTTDNIGFTLTDQTSWDTAAPALVVGRFRLLPSSPWHGTASDGLDFGADIDAILAALGGADPLVGVPSQVLTVVPAAGARSGAPLTTQPVFSICDVYGDVCTDSTLTATITKLTGPAVVTNGVKQAAAGIITYTNLTVTGEGDSTFLLTVG